jgi:hypothetical protein
MPVPPRLLLGTGLAAYLLFHAVRADLPPGPFRDAFPSVLFLPVAFAAVDLAQALRSRPPWSRSPGTRIAATLTAVLVLEALGPRLLARGTADPADALALVLGALLHRILTRPPGAPEAPSPDGP